MKHVLRLFSGTIRSLRTTEELVRRYIIHLAALSASCLMPPRSRPRISASIPGKSNDRITFRVVPHGVDDLICEDWDEALGIQCGWRDGDIPSIEVTPARGVMALWKTDGGLRIVEAERLDRYTDALLGEASSESLVTDPSFSFSHHVWPTYLPGGAIQPDQR